MSKKAPKNRSPQAASRAGRAQARKSRDKTSGAPRPIRPMRSGSRARWRPSPRTCPRHRRPPGAADSFASADAFVWHPNGRLAPVPRVSRVDLGLLKGIDRMRDILIENTERFANGLPANNALLWGARGMGKSSLVKAAHASINVSRKPAGTPEADRDSPRGHREPAGADGHCCAARTSASSCSATTCRSTATTPPTSR